ALPPRWNAANPLRPAAPVAAYGGGPPRSARPRRCPGRRSAPAGNHLIVDFGFSIFDYGTSSADMSSGALTGHCQSAIANRKSKILNQENPPLQLGTDQQRYRVQERAGDLPTVGGAPLLYFAGVLKRTREPRRSVWPGAGEWNRSSHDDRTRAND